MKLIICRVKHLSLKIVCADEMSKIVNLKAVNNTVFFRDLCYYLI